MPFSIVLVLACVSLYRAFRYEVAVMPRYVRVSRTREQEQAVHDGEGGAATDGDATGGDAAGGDAARGDAAGDRTRGQHAPGRREVSATLAGLSRSERGPRRGGNDMVVAIHEVPTHQVRADGSGRLTADEVSDDDDPLAGEHFDTPEFADSAEGQSTTS